MPDLREGVGVRELTADDFGEVVRIDAGHAGRSRPPCWRRAFGRFFERARDAGLVGLCVDGAQGLEGYLLGEVREAEFGSEPCGWVFAVGVDARALRRGVASVLMRRAASAFRDLGVTKVRTMVRRNDVSMLALFRASGFEGGPFVQLERDLDREEE